MGRIKYKTGLILLVVLIIIIGGVIFANNIESKKHIICYTEIADLSLLSYEGEVNIDNINGYSIDNGEYITLSDIISAKKGEHVVLKFDIYNALEDGQTTGIGILYDTTAYYIYKRKTEKQILLDFTAPIDGEFKVFISGLSSDPIKVKEINILY